MKTKVLVSKKHNVSIISSWVKPGNFDLSICTIDEPSLNLSLNLILGSLEEAKKFIKEEYGESPIKNLGNGTIAVSFNVEKEGFLYNYINIQKNEWLAMDYGVICHELHHFTHHALAEKGIDYCEGGEELFAYIQGYFMENVVRALITIGKVMKNKKKK